MSIRLELADVDAGKALDAITIDGDAVTYDTGIASGIVESTARNRQLTPSQAALSLSGWSNGYIRITPRDREAAND